MCAPSVHARAYKGLLSRGAYCSNAAYFQTSRIGRWFILDTPGDLTTTSGLLLLMGLDKPVTTTRLSSASRPVMGARRGSKDEDSLSQVMPKSMNNILHSYKASTTSIRDANSNCPPVLTHPMAQKEESQLMINGDGHSTLVTSEDLQALSRLQGPENHTQHD
eukprot:gene5277-2414_t